MCNELDLNRIPQARVRSFRETYFAEDFGTLPVNHTELDVATLDPVLGRALRYRRRKRALALKRVGDAEVLGD